MTYTAWSVVFGEQPSAAKWNQLGSNDAGFKDGTNIDAGAIVSEKLGATIAFSASRTTAQSVTGGAAAKLQLATEAYDTGSDFDAVTNHRFVAPVTGIYHFDGQALMAGPERMFVSLYKNNAEAIRGNDVETSVSGGGRTATVSSDLKLVATDYVELFAFCDDTSDANPATLTGHFIGVG